jgi:hypothetical protein
MSLGIVRFRNAQTRNSNATTYDASRCLRNVTDATTASTTATKKITYVQPASDPYARAVNLLAKMATAHQ